jgi:hypothetical protein
VSALRLSQVVPASVIRGRWVVVLVCYLDESGTDPQNPVITVGGYCGTEEQWGAFEAAVEPVFGKYGVAILHARDLHASDGEFAGWSRLRKEAFVAELCRTLSKSIPLGMSMSAAKDQYAAYARKQGNRRTVTPYTFCANVILDWVMTDIHVGRIANVDGVAFVLEDGFHSSEAEWNFREVICQHDLAETVRAVCFVGKASCRAIQMADLFAFYSRRHAVEMEAAHPDVRAEIQFAPGPMLNIITESVPHRSFVATGFEPKAPEGRPL